MPGRRWTLLRTNVQECTEYESQWHDPAGPTGCASWCPRQVEAKRCTSIQIPCLLPQESSSHPSRESSSPPSPRICKPMPSLPVRRPFPGTLLRAPRSTRFMSATEERQQTTPASWWTIFNLAQTSTFLCPQFWAVSEVRKLLVTSQLHHPRMQ